MASQRPRHDCIIIFGAAVRADGSPGGTLRRRVAAAMRFAEAAGPVRFLVTGGLGRHPPAEALVMRRLLLELGAYEDQILVEDKARNTRESAILCARMLQGRDDVGAVIVCTSRYHIRRCRMLLRMRGIRTAGGAASEDAGFVSRGRHTYSWLREMVAIPVDAVRMTWHRLQDAER